MAEHVSKQVKSGENTITILREINLAVKKGETLAILGTSGSGKTTLLTLLAGIDKPTAGNIFFNSAPLNHLNEDQLAAIRRNHVGFIFQSFHLLPTMTALENVSLPLDICGIPFHEARARATEWLVRVGLQERLNHYPLTLSGGEQQRVAIARAFINQPDIIFADEMTGNLDTNTGEKITEILFTLNKNFQTTLILVTHDQTLAKQCQRQLTLHEGVLTPCL